MTHSAFIAQSGERQTEDLVVAGSIPAEGIPFGYFLLFFSEYGNVPDILFAPTQFLKKKKHKRWNGWIHEFRGDDIDVGENPMYPWKYENKHIKVKGKKRK